MKRTLSSTYTYLLSLSQVRSFITRRFVLHHRQRYCTNIVDLFTYLPNTSLLYQKCHRLKSVCCRITDGTNEHERCDDVPSDWLLCPLRAVPYVQVLCKGIPQLSFHILLPFSRSFHCVCDRTPLRRGTFDLSRISCNFVESNETNRLLQDYAVQLSLVHSIYDCIS